MKCTKCKGIGMFLPPEGTTKSDFIHCHICNGTGERPVGYVAKNYKNKTQQRYARKTDGLEDLKKIIDDSF